MALFSILHLEADILSSFGLDSLVSSSWPLSCAIGIFIIVFKSEFNSLISEAKFSFFATVKNPDLDARA